MDKDGLLRLMLPFNAKLLSSDGSEWMACEYMDEIFGVYFIGEEKLNYVVFSYISEPEAVLPIAAKQLNDLNEGAQMARYFLDERGCLNMNAKIIGYFVDMQPKSVAFFLEAWMDDFDRLIRFIGSPDAH